MARLLQVLSVFSRVGVLSVEPPASTRGCRFASRSGGAPWVGGSASKRASVYDDGVTGEGSSLEDVEDKLQALAEEGRKRRQTVKFHMLRRRMTPSGAPQRKLTWSAIEQIRYLKEEQPEEWTVERLAEGFSVTPEVILRVLRSKFVPPPERKANQDAKISAELGQRVLASGARTAEDRLKLTGNQTPAVLLPGRRDGSIAPVADRALMLQDQSVGSLAPVPLAAPNTQTKGETGRDASAARSREEDTISETDTQPHEHEESWDGRVWTEEELEEFLEMENTSPVVQVGKDFFDAEGNFLYSI
ncbi:neugrin [Nelusetta ayraudi]|uniref:neugrin n=1 Tax=Nelusetta ayraudi TaxID=303726 RepID=UPI003F6F4F02